MQAILVFILLQKELESVKLKKPNFVVYLK